MIAFEFPLGSCAVQSAEAVYQEAQSHFRKGEFAASFSKAREGFGKWPSGEWGWKFRLQAVEALAKTGNLQRASALLAAGGEPASPGLEARYKIDSANLSGGSDALKLLREAVPLANASHDPNMVCLAELFLGENETDPEQADIHAQASLRAARQAGDAFLLTWARLGRGYNRARFARYDEALPYFAAALATGQACGARALVAAIRGNQGWCYHKLGDYDHALDALRQAESSTAALGQRAERLKWLIEIGVLHLDRGDYGPAEAFEQQAAKLAGEVEDERLEAMAFHNLAQIALEKNNLAAARAYNDKVLASETRRSDEVSLAYTRLTLAELDHLSKDYAQAERDYRAVIEQAQKVSAKDLVWEGYAGLGSLYDECGKPHQAAAEYGHALEFIDREWKSLGSQDSQATYLTLHRVGLFQDYVNFLIKTGQPEKALEIAESARARLLNQQLERVGELPPDFDLPRLQRAAGASHTVILSYWLEPARSSVWMIGGGKLLRYDLPPGKEIEELVRKHTETVVHGGDPLARDGGSLALYKAVLAPVQALIPAGSNVIIVPDGALHQLDFETLVVPAPKPHYWIDDVAIAIAPSLRALQGNDRRAAPAPKLLLLGDPVLAGGEFLPLPNAKAEIAAVEECFPPANRAAFTGLDAVPAKYAEAEPGKFTNIHFATHATANLQSPLNSAIILSHQGENYKLYARDVAAVPLNAGLVTISACHSAGAKAYSGEGLMGFAWAFLQAGARNVIATLWDEDDAASVNLMRTLYTQMAAGATPARALRAAKLTLMHSEERFRTPYYWGPLQVFTREVARQ